MNQHDKIMTKNLTQSFIHHRNVSLASQTVAEFPFHHTERGFDIGPFMVMRHEFGAAKLEVMKHFRPRSVATSHGIRFESDKRGGSDIGDSIGVFPRAVGFISGDFRNLKILRRRIDQSRKHLNVTRKLVVNLNGSDDIGFDAAHQMAFHPILLLFNRAVLEVKPAGKTTSRETGRIGGEVCLNRFQRQTALSYQGAENGSQIEDSQDSWRCY